MASRLRAWIANNDKLVFCGAIVLLVLAGFRYEIVSTGVAVGFVLDRWTGEVVFYKAAEKIVTYERSD